MIWSRSHLLFLIVGVSLLACGAPAAQPQLEPVYRDMAVLAWRIQFHYVWTGKYPEALDKVFNGKPDDKKQTLGPADIVDPFSPLKLPYGYILSEDGKSFLLYSVGPDGVDERGRWVYPFWPSSHLWSELPDKGPNGTIRGDLVIDSKELAEHWLAVSRDDLHIPSPLLFEYTGAKDLGQGTPEWVEGMEKELEKLNTPSTLESRQEESYLETFHRFCSEHNIELRAVDVDMELARCHAPIPRKTAGTYELLNELARACGLRVISARADIPIDWRIVVGGEPGEEASFILLLEPYYWQGCNVMLLEMSTLLTNPSDPGQRARLKEVCNDVASVSGDELKTIVPWFPGVVRQVVGTREPAASDD